MVKAFNLLQGMLTCPPTCLPSPVALEAQARAPRAVPCHAVPRSHLCPADQLRLHARHLAQVVQRAAGRHAQGRTGLRAQHHCGGGAGGGGGQSAQPRHHSREAALQHSKERLVGQNSGAVRRHINACILAMQLAVATAL